MKDEKVHGVDDADTKHRSKLSELHNEIDMKRLQESLTSSVENYVKPKVEINEVTLHENGEISLKMRADIPERTIENLMSLIRVVNRAVKEHEEEILNG